MSNQTVHDSFRLLPACSSRRGCQGLPRRAAAQQIERQQGAVFKGSERQQHLRLRVGDKPIHKGAVIAPTGKELLMEGVPSSTGHISVVAPVCGYLLLGAHVCYLQPDTGIL